MRLQRGVARLERSFQRLLFAIVWVSVFVGVGAFCLDTRVGRSIAWMNSRRNRIHTEHSCFLLLLKWQLLDTPTSLHIFPAAIAKSCALRVACTICLSRRSKAWLLKLEKLRRREATPRSLLPNDAEGCLIPTFDSADLMQPFDGFVLQFGCSRFEGSPIIPIRIVLPLVRKFRTFAECTNRLAQKEADGSCSKSNDPADFLDVVLETCLDDFAGRIRR